MGPMSPNELMFFAIFLFCALSALLIWRHRRLQKTARVNRGLRSYAAKAVASEEDEDEELAVA